MTREAVQLDSNLLQACEELQDAVYVKDLDGRYLVVNAAGGAAVGLERDELVGRTDREVFPDDWEMLQRADRQVVASGASETSEEAVVVDGELRTYLTTKAPLRDRSGEIRGVIAISTDISARAAAEEELDVTDRNGSGQRLQANEAMLNIAQELTRVGSFEWEIATDRVTWSDGLYRIFGLDPGEVPGTFEEYLDRVHPEEREERHRTIETVVETGRGADGEHRIVRADGEVRWIESRIRRLADENGNPTRLVGICQDVTERKLATAELESEVEAAQERALHDPLTGLPNRTLAFDRLQHAFVLARRRESDLAVLFIDIDGFKRVNDRFGHAVGDTLLTSVAQRLHGSVRGSDTVARIGGDEFLVVCEEAAAASQVVEAADRIHRAFATPFALNGSEELISLSIGASTIGDRRVGTVSQLVEEADAAMYSAKRRGPGGFAFSQLVV